MVIIYKKWAAFGAFTLFVSVILGALGAHALKLHLSNEQLSSFQTGVHYAQLHGITIILLSFLNQQYQTKNLFWLFAIGTMLFSGSIFLLATKDLHQLPIAWLGPITPIGGLLLIFGWLLLAIKFLRTKAKIEI